MKLPGAMLQQLFRPTISTGLSRKLLISGIRVVTAVPKNELMQNHPPVLSSGRIHHICTTPLVFKHTNVSELLGETSQREIAEQQMGKAPTVAKDVEAPVATDRNGNPKDRSRVIPVEVSMQYLQSEAYKETYGDKPVWVPYRRNFKGQFAPRLTRQRCIRKGMVTTGNPCPICRDEYLIVDYRNVELLKQFISPYNGEILGFSKTNVCRQQHTLLLCEIAKAKDYGLITFGVPFREYNYDEYKHIYETHEKK